MTTVTMANSTWQFDVGIQAIGYRLGSRTETATDLVLDNPDWRIEDIERKTGIKVRHLAAVGETASDLAAAAAHKLLGGGVERESLDALVFVTQSPDYVLPTTACLLQHRLSLPTHCVAFDVNQGCSGFVYGLGIATSLISSRMAQKVLLLCGDTYSRYIQPDDRSCRPIFSDGAAAVVIGRGGNASVGAFVFGSDGTGAPNLIVTGSGARDSGTGRPRLSMNGPQVFMFTISAVPKLVRQVLAKAGLEVADIDLFVFHQASALVLENIARQLGVASDRIYSNLTSVGNTVSASIPIALADAFREGRLLAGQTVLICGFGVGYSWAGAILRWGEQPLVT